MFLKTNDYVSFSLTNYFFQCTYIKSGRSEVDATEGWQVCVYSISVGGMFSLSYLRHFHNMAYCVHTQGETRDRHHFLAKK